MGEVLRLRARHEPARLRFPIEITVAGSSGLGWFSAGQSRAELVRRVNRIVAGYKRFGFRFDKVLRFPQSHTYYLAPREERQFRDFQRRLADSGLRFAPTAFVYLPHCTIGVLSRTPTRPARKEIESCLMPASRIEVLSVSLYEVDTAAQICRQGERFLLGK